MTCCQAARVILRILFRSSPLLGFWVQGDEGSGFRVCPYGRFSKFKIGGRQYRPKNAMVLVMRIPKKVILILGNPHVSRSPQGEGSREAFSC